MATRFCHIVIDAADPPALARFWAAALGWPVTYDDPEVVTAPPEDDPAQAGQPPLVFVPVGDPKRGKNRVHLDLASTSLDDQAAQVARLQELGATPADVGQGDEVPWVVLADPEGNELCVLEPRPLYEGLKPFAAIVLDAEDPAGLAPFWAAATGWTVDAADRDSATLRRPDGTGAHLELLRNGDARTGKLRVHLDVAPHPDDDQAAEVERLVGLGARRIDIGQGDAYWVVLADPEGNELCVLTPR